MNHEIRIPYRRPVQTTVGMNLWLTQKMKAVYREDWCWDHGPGGYIYKFKDEQMAMVFALRWS